jgi:hypothetical protein
MKALKNLQKRLKVVRNGRRDPQSFYKLVVAMEDYRDYVRDHLASLTARHEEGFQEQSAPLTNEAWELAQEAHKNGLIPEWLMLDIGVLMNCISFVCVYPVVNPADLNLKHGQEARP